jgi:hypothetical protein
VIASSLPWMLAGQLQGSGGRPIPLTVRLLFYIGAVAFFRAVIWTVLSTKERPPEDLEALRAMKLQSRGTMAGAREIFASIRAMPQTMRQLAWVQVCTWMGLLCMWIYFPVAVATTCSAQQMPLRPSTRRAWPGEASASRHTPRSASRFRLRFPRSLASCAATSRIEFFCYALFDPRRLPPGRKNGRLYGHIQLLHRDSLKFSHRSASAGS